MKGLLRFSFLHLSLFIGALILSDLWVFLGLSFLVGWVPRMRINFFYYLLLSVLAFVVALFINPIPDFINQSVSDIMKLESVSLWLIIALVSVLTMSLMAKAANALLLIFSPASKPETEEEEEDFID
ncbi:hypothetical protein [Croceimicrobium sp.]|uniref:hypothetical protein n=1 Tax=Croceimicrobium sp. TaxID=2828340 RepID=UPI003BAD936F